MKQLDSHHLSSVHGSVTSKDKQTLDSVDNAPFLLNKSSGGEESNEEKDPWEFLLDKKTGKRVTISGKPVILWRAKSVLNMASGFAHKKLCTGPTFNLGDACTYTCEFCYVEDATRGRFKGFLKKEGLEFQNVVIRRKSALEILKIQLERLSEESRNYHHVVYSSTTVDVAATVELAKETVQACILILNMTNWEIRLLSKSNLLPFLVLQIPKKFRDRLIVGCSTGTLDDKLAQAIETGTPLVNKRIASIREVQRMGIRTFAMICPSMPMRSVKEYEDFARSAAELLCYEKMEHVWAEPMNVHGDNFTRTIRSLEAAGQTDTVKLLNEVCGDHESARDKWEEYSRLLFEAHKKVVSPKKLRFLQFVNRDQDLPYWKAQEPYGAVILGTAEKRAAKKQNGSTNTQKPENGRPIVRKVVCSTSLTLSRTRARVQTLPPELSKAEHGQFAECEATIRKGFVTFVEVGDALAIIRDSRLYRETHTSFESYCWERWQFGRAHAHRQINAAKVLKSLSPNGDMSLPPGVPLPNLEAQVRPLVGLDGDAARVAWVKAVEKANGCRVTAKLLQAQIESPKKPTTQPASNAIKARDRFNDERLKILAVVDKIEKLVASTKFASILAREIVKLRKLAR